MIRLKRVYEEPAPEDGFRVLIERLWPRGMTKERAHIDLWIRDAGASTDLRKWFAHDPEKWDEFKQKYFLELSERPEVIRQLVDLIHDNKVVTFMFSAHDEEHNNAVALKMYLKTKGENV